MPTYCWSSSEITKRKQQVVNATFFKLQEGSGGSVKNNPQTGDTADSRLLDIIQGSGTTYYKTQEGAIKANVPCICGTSVEEINRMEGFVPGNILFMVAGSLYYTDDNSNVVSLNPNTTFKWYFKGEGFANGTEPFIDENGNIYYATRSYLYSIDSNGYMRWKVSISEFIVGIYGANNILFISTVFGKIYRYGYDSTLYNFITVDTNSELIGPVRIGSNGNIYSLLYKQENPTTQPFVYTFKYVILDNTLNNIQIISTGEIVSRPVSSIYNNIYSVFYNNNVFLLSDNGTLYSYNLSNNTQTWVVNTNLIGRKVSPVIINNTIYELGDSGIIYKISINGNILQNVSNTIGIINQIGYDNNYIYTYNNNRQIITIRLNDLHITTGFSNTNQSTDLSCITSLDKSRLYTFINDTRLIEVDKNTLQPL